jgi:hypothetical protein
MSTLPNDDLERLIRRRGADVLRLHKRSTRACCAGQRDAWLEEARLASADVGMLSAMRSPETVRRLEAERRLS